jgi:hypothetical protein
MANVTTIPKMRSPIHGVVVVMRTSEPNIASPILYEGGVNTEEQV